MTLRILAGQLWDGTGNAPIVNGELVVEGDRIVAAGAAGAAPSLSDADVLDLHDQFVMPGLIDAHTHISLIAGEGNLAGQMRQPLPAQLLRAVGNVRRDLASGVTTARVLGEEHWLDLELRTAIAARQIAGPRLLCATRGITASNGPGTAFSHADGVDEIRRFARENLRAGADWLKTFATGGVSSAHTTLDYVVYSREELAAATEEAHRVGKGIAAHAHGGPGLRLCLEVGVDTIEHGGLAGPAELEAIAASGAWLICTLSILFHPNGLEQGDGAVPAIRAKMLRARQVVGENTGRIPQSGVKYALGTDAMHGHLPTEAEMLVQFGATAREALLAATGRAAQAVHIADQTGTLTPGKLADVISIHGNPLEDITALRRIGLIMKDGIRYDPLSSP